jgi:hypothetical protein
MKNVHVLPTEKPSRLGYIFELESYHIFTNGEDSNDLGDNLATNRHIYITDDSDIKQGEWFYLDDAIIVVKYIDVKPVKEGKKIILTTDTDLIADGVQAIDDAFLEWFVENPECEVVEINFNNRGITGTEKILKTFGEYKIIIPQEEAKKETLTYSEALKKEERIFNSTMMLTQKTLDEFIEKEVYEEGMFSPHIWSDGVRAGAKWQAERMYSEEEVFSILDKVFHMYASSYRKEAREWFEQFKKQKS